MDGEVISEIHGKITISETLKENDFKCLKCPKTFSRKTNWRRHLIKIHRIDRSELDYVISFVCNYCSQIFNDIWHLKHHRKLAHPYENLSVKNIQLPFCVHECAHCGETFQKKNSLRVHMKKRHFSDIFDCKLLEYVIPDWRNDINVTKYTVLNQDQGQFFSIFSINLRNRNEWNKWLSEFQHKNKITLRKRSIHRSVKPNIIYHAKYGCHHNTKPKLGTNVSRKHTKCPASLQCKIFVSTDEAKNYTEVRMAHIHNHAFDSLAVLKFREPILEIKDKFRSMFLSGMTPSQALQQHKKDLEQQYGDEFHNIVGDRGICPNKSWVYNFRSVCLKNPEKFKSETITISNLVKLSTNSRNIIFTSPKCVENYSSCRAEIDGDFSRNDTNKLIDICVTNETDNLNSLSENISRNEKAVKPFQEKSNIIFLENNTPTNGNSPDSFRAYSNGRVVNFSFIEKMYEIHEEEPQNDDIIPFHEIENNDRDDDSTSDDYIFGKFDQMNEIIKDMTRENPFLFSGLQQMVHNFHQNLGDPVSLNNALYTFGKN